MPNQNRPATSRAISCLSPGRYLHKTIAILAVDRLWLSRRYADIDRAEMLASILIAAARFPVALPICVARTRGEISRVEINVCGTRKWVYLYSVVISIAVGDRFQFEPGMGIGSKIRIPSIQIDNPVSS